MASAVGFVGRAGWCARLMWAPSVSAAPQQGCCLLRALVLRRSSKTSAVFCQLARKSRALRKSLNCLRSRVQAKAMPKAGAPRQLSNCAPPRLQTPGLRASVPWPLQPSLDAQQRKFLRTRSARVSFVLVFEFFGPKSSCGLPTQPRISHRHRRRSPSGRAAQKTRK